MTKLKIDLGAGIIEVEGEESFVREIYDEFRERLSIAHSGNIPPKSGGNGMRAVTLEKPDKTSKSRSVGKRKESYSFVGSLNLNTGGKESLKEFYARKAPGTGMEINTVLVYYLQKELQIAGIGVNHIYTCYKHLQLKLPSALRQNIIDTSNRKAWIDTKSTDNITVSTLGENFVEHELPRKQPVKK